MRAFIIFAAVILFAAGTAPAADLELLPRPNTKAAPASTPAATPKPAPTSAAPSTDVSIQSYGDHDAACLTWTDGCRNCERASDGPNCSNIGIACQPGAIKCTGRK